MKKSFILFLVVHISIVFSLQADLSKEMVATAKRATVFVDLPDELGSGTAFCVHSNGFFISNAHVVEEAKGRKIKIVVNPGLREEKIYSAQVLRIDAQADLALLRVDNSGATFPVLKLGSVSNLTETANITGFGYPFGKALATDSGKYPSISVNMGKITALRMEENVLDQIQIDAALNPGNSGGPVLDDAGLLIGVIVSGIRGAGVNFAIPITKAVRLLEAPEIAITAPTEIAWINRFAPVSVEARVGSILGSTKQEYHLVMTMEDGFGIRTNAMVRTGPGTYRAQVALMRLPGVNTLYAFDLTLADASMESRVKDTVFHIGNTQLHLCEIAAMEGIQGGYGVVSIYDSTHAGPIKGMTEWPLQVAGTLQKIPLNRIRRIERKEALTIDSVKYQITATSSGGASIEATGDIQLSQIPSVEMADKPLVTPSLRLPASLLKGLALYYSFDRDEKGKITDKSGKGNHGTVASAKWVADGKKAGAYRFGGHPQLIEARDNPAFDLKPDDDKTFACWWKGEGDIQHKTLLAKWDYGINFGFALLTLKEGLYYMPCKPDCYAKWKAHFSYEGWNHVVVVKRGTNWKVYDNGTECALMDSRGWPLSADITAPGPFAVGSSVGSPNDYGLRGLIDEVMVFGRALSGEEVKTLYDLQK